MTFAKKTKSVYAVWAVRALAAAMLLLTAGCGSSGGSSGSTSDLSCSYTTSSNNPTAPSGTNIVSLDVADSSNSGTGEVSYIPNLLVTSVTICVPGTSSCQTIPNVQVDTGSYGLRLFKSAITLPISLGSTDSSKISQINEPSDNPEAECVLFGIGAEWGPVGKADVKLGSLTASNVRFMMIDSTYGSIPSYSGCASSTLDTSPSADGYNGIIGVGLFTTDCGADGCDPSSTSYYGCPSGTNCSLAKVGLNYTSVSSSGASGLTNNGSIATAYQVQNPIAQMPTGYNNGTAITLPSLSTCGASVVKGYMALGVASVTNNTPSTTPTIIKAASSTISGSIVAGYMYTDWNGYEYNGLIDSGTSTWAIVPNSDLSDCGGSYSGFLCPSDTPSLSASMVAADNSVTKSISFTIGNAESLFNSSNTAYPSLGTSLSSSSDLFIWGLPFFYGRTVYTVINGKTATGVGTGPLWAY